MLGILDDFQTVAPAISLLGARGGGEALGGMQGKAGI